MNENPETPAREQIAAARDAATFARLILADHREPGRDMIQSFINDPESIPGVMYGLAGMVAHALTAPPETTPEEFFDEVFHTLDAAEHGDV